EDVAEDAEVEVECGQGAPGVAGGQERALEAVLARDLHPPAVPGRPAAADSGEQAPPLRIGDHGGQQLTSPPAGDRDAVHGEPVEEVGGAVERVDQPFVLALAEAGAAPLLGEDAVV